MLTVIVHRKKWYRGYGSTKSGLLREDGQKCCIGFLATALGVREEDQLYKPYLKNVRHKIPKKPGHAKLDLSNFSQFYSLNDRDNISEE